MRSLRRSFVFAAICGVVLFSQVTSARRIDGTVSGTVTATGGGAVTGAQVQFFPIAGGVPFTAPPTDAAGNYSINLAAGQYRVRTFSTPGLVDELYPNIVCLSLGCDITDGTPITVSDGGSLDIDFQLDQGGTVSGTITGEGVGGLSGVFVSLANAAGQSIGSTTTGAGGIYDLNEGVPSGSYFVRTAAPTSGIAADFIPEAYPNSPCTQSCVLASATPITVTAPAATTGIDMTLSPGAWFTGTITSDGATGLDKVTVDVLNAAGSTIASSLATTGGTGTYRTVPALGPGVYYLRTRNSAGRLNKFHDGTPCVGFSCTVGAVEPLTVAGSGAQAPINLTLPAGAQFTGTLLGAGAAIGSGANISVLSNTGATLTFATIVGSTYTTNDGVPPGTYYLRTSNQSGFINELHSGVQCAPACTTSSGTGLVVGGPGLLAGPNFNLVKGAQITGTVTGTEAGNPPIGGTTVSIVNAAGIVQSTAIVAGNGSYTTDAGVLSGSYRVVTSNSSGYINRTYPTSPCEGTICDPSAGSPVALVAGPTPATVNITLDKGGQIAGTITNGGAAIPGAQAQVLNAAGTVISTGATDLLGNYLTGAGLVSGNYKVRTFNSVGFINELYDNQPCGPTCNLNAGSPQSVTTGAVTAGVNFDLAQGGRVSGTVLGAGSPLIGATVQLFSPTLGVTLSATTDGTGQYSIGGLTPGTYYARTTNNAGFINETYDNIQCAFTCNNLTLGAPLIVTATEIAGINFNLAAGARIAGHIQEDGTGTPLPGVSITVVDAGGAVQSTAVTDAFGNYTTNAGLLSGSYFVRTSNTLGYLNEVFNDLPCPVTCTLITATPVTVFGGGTTSGIDFGLTKGGRVSGVVTDASTGLPIVGATVSIFDGSGRPAASATTDASGAYTSGAGLTTGTYYARTSNLLGYQDELWNNVKCPQTCTVTAGTSFNVTSGLTLGGVNFALDKGVRITGTVTNAATSEPIAGVTVQLYDASGRFFTSAFTNSFGIYTTQAGVPGGATYFARTQNGLGYINELFGGNPCLGNCTVTDGTPIVLPASGTAGPIDFALEIGGRIQGTVTLAGAPATKLSNISIAIFDATGASVSSAVTNAIGEYITTNGLPTGTYFARTANAKGFINGLYNVGACVGCDPTTGTGISVTIGAVAGGIDFALAQGARISGTVTRSDTSGPVSGALVSFYNASGTRVATGFADNNGLYATNEGLPAGTYFGRTENQLGLVNQIYNGISCAVSCDPTTGTGIAVTPPFVQPGINFVLTPDADADGDGIVNTIDTAAGFSNDFDDTPQGGTTSGTIAARGGFTVKVGDLSPGGVQATVTGAGTTASLDTCALNGLERVNLNVAGEIASITCLPTTGSTSVRAIVASPTIELRDPPTGPGVIVLLTTGQAASVGSPVTADPTNDEPIVVKIVDAGGVEIGSFTLDPGESAEATVEGDGSVDTEVVNGTVTFTVRGETATLTSGQSHDFPPPGPPMVFGGFLFPIQNPPGMNLTISGLPQLMRFSLGGNFGTNIFAAGSPRSVKINCSTFSPVGAEEPAQALLPLTYLPLLNQYLYTWNTKSWGGTCREFRMTLTNGTTHIARFRFLF